MIVIKRVTIFRRLTRADFRNGESADLLVVVDLNYIDVKNPHINIEAFLNMAEVTRFELSICADFRYNESTALPITTTPNLLQ